MRWIIKIKRKINENYDGGPIEESLDTNNVAEIESILNGAKYTIYDRAIITPESRISNNPFKEI